MDLRIKFMNKKLVNMEGDLSVKGQIKIGEFKECFYSPINYWSVEDYERQWQEGIDRLKNYNKSCLVVFVYDPKDTPFVEWWLLYKKDDKVYVRNQIVFDKIYENQIGNKPFTLETCYNFIRPRNTKRKVSEWVVDYP